MEGLLGLLLLGVAATVLIGMGRSRRTPGQGPGRTSPVTPLTAPRDAAPLDALVVDQDGAPPPAGSAASPSASPAAGSAAGSVGTPARVSRRGDDLLRYGGGSGPGVPHPGGYAALGLLTTGYAPMKDAVVELAVVHLDAQAQVTQTFSTLVRPAHGEPAADTLGTIDTDDLLAAPTFAEVAPRLLELLSGVVVVAHHGGHAGRFLAARFLQAGMLPEPMPALSLDRFGPGPFGTPNLRAATLARRLGIDHPVPATAQDQARLVAACLPTVLARWGSSLRYPCAPVDQPAGSAVVPGTVLTGGSGGSRRHRRQAAAPVPFLAELFALAPIGAQEMNDPRVAAYLEDVASLLAQGRMVKTELADLAQRMARAGTSTDQLRDISARFLESLREAAFRRTSLSSTDVRHLRAAATSLGVPGYFDDLIPPPPPQVPAPGSGSFARPVRKPPPQQPPARLPRCGNCLRMGHYTAACPMPPAGRALGAGRVEPPGRVSPIRPIGPA